MIKREIMTEGIYQNETGKHKQTNKQKTVKRMIKIAKTVNRKR